MASTSQKRDWWQDWECNTSKMVRHPFPGSPSSNWNLWVADESKPAWELFTDLMRQHSYYFRESSGGTYKCRNIAGSTKKSLHAYGIAVDLNPSANPFHTQRHDYPQGFIDDVLETGLFRWGIEFDDPMHWEIDVPPEEIDMPITEADANLIVDTLFARQLRVSQVPFGLAADRDYRNINELTLAFRAGELDTLSDDEVQAIANAANDELARRAAG